MLTVRNLTARPLRVPLPQHRLLHLGPGQVGEATDEAAAHPPLAALAAAGEVEILHGAHDASGRPLSEHGHASTRRPAQPKRAGVRGDR
ncbi:MAG: hypothetical protein M5U13_05960 [Thermoanaerobaculia bacterium]|nr:hypothetical protein [Thermoanaerobaculia bacterium]